MYSVFSFYQVFIICCKSVTCVSVPREECMKHSSETFQFHQTLTQTFEVTSKAAFFLRNEMLSEFMF